MALLITYKKKVLFDLLVNMTSLYSRNMEEPKLRMSDAVYVQVKPWYCQAGARVLDAIGAYTEGIQIPYIQTKEGENFPESDSINFTLYTPEGSRDGVNVPLIEARIKEFILNYVLNQWFETFGMTGPKDLKESLSAIKRAVTYGSKPKQKIRLWG